MSKSNTFVFDLEWYEILKQYPADVRMEVYEAIMEYASSGKLPELKPIANMAFSFIRPKMDSNRARYETTVEKRRQAGRSSAEAKSRQKGTQLTEAIKAQQNEQPQQTPTKSTNVGFVEPSQQNQQMLTNVEQSQQTEHKPTRPNKAEQPQQTPTNSTDNDNVYDNIYNEYYLMRVNAGDAKIREAYLNIYFSERKQISLDELLKKWETTREELTMVCDEVLMDWTHEDIQHNTVEEAKKYFHNAVRYKYSILKSKQYDGKKGKSSGKGSRPSGPGDARPRRNALDSQPKPGYSLDG